MSRKRAKYLVQMCNDNDQMLSYESNIQETSDYAMERVSSPLRAEENESSQLKAMLQHVFDENIEDFESSSIQKPNCNDDESAMLPYDSFNTTASNIVINDVNLHAMMVPESPLNINSCKNFNLQTPSPVPMTPQSIEPIFSVNSYDQDHNNVEHTPVPSPYCDFSDSSQSADETLIPISAEDADKTITVNFIDSALNVPTISDTTSMSEIATPSSVTTLSAQDSDFSLDSPKNKRISRKRCDKGRKRIKHIDNWIAIKRKHLCNRGESYTTMRGKTKEARKIKPSCNRCRLRCSDKISESTRIELFSKFWNTGNHVKQWQIIGKYVSQTKKKTSTNIESNRRTNTLHYNLPNNNSLQKVCKTMFLNTFDISKDFVYTALQKVQNSNDFDNITDDRGRHQNHKLVMTSEMKQSVIEHVNSFQPVEAHYVRKRSAIKYLDSSLSFSKMFQMYPDWCKENNYHTTVKTLRQYRDIVNMNLKIGFHLPKKDQCDLCHQFKNVSCPSDAQRERFLLHQNEKEVSRQLKLETKMLAMTNKNIACIVFDFQKVLSSPHGNISVYYYRRKLNVYNFTIYDMGSKQGFCYMWGEHIAKRGANEVASCLFDFLSKLAVRGVKEAHLWSDNCGGQNRNRIVYFMYLLAAKKFNIKISHHFMEKGHTQNEGDSVHALIEKTAKGKEIYTPDEWYSLVRWAKVNDTPYTVVEVNQNMIFDFKTSLLKKNWTKNLNNEKVQWNKIKEIVVSPQDDGLLTYKYSLSQTVISQIQCLKKSNTRLSRPEPFPKQAYSNFLKINRAKYNDLKYFCDNNIIPEKYHNFYMNLKVLEQSNDQDNDPAHCSEEDD